MTSDFNLLLRQAAGRGDVKPTGEQDAPGDVGIGRGGASGPQRRESGSERMNGVIRRGALIARLASVQGGVNVDTVNLDDLYRR